MRVQLIEVLLYCAISLSICHRFTLEKSSPSKSPMASTFKKRAQYFLQREDWHGLCFQDDHGSSKITIKKSLKKQLAAPPILSNSIGGKGVAYQPVSGLEKKKLEFQLVLWASSSRILLAWCNFLLVLVNEFVRGGDPCLTNGQVSFKSYLRSKITFPRLLDETFLCCDWSNFQHNKPVYPLQWYLSIPYLHCCSIRIDLLCQDGG